MNKAVFFILGIIFIILLFFIAYCSKVSGDAELQESEEATQLQQEGKLP